MNDVRQSPQWSNFLETLGWKSFRTSNDINIEIRYTPFGSFIKIQKPKPFGSSDLDEIEKICIDNKSLFIKIEPYIGQDIDLLARRGYEISMWPMTPTSTYFIDLEKSEEELWDSISHSGKYSIHRAKREGAKVEIYRKPERGIFEKFYEILKYTGARQHFYVPPLTQVLSQAEVFGDNGFLLTVSDKEGQLCGGKWHVGHKDAVLYISGATSEIGHKNKSGYELVWKSILYFKSLGFKTFDMEGKDDQRFPSLTKDWGGFSHFKEKFGGDIVDFPYPRVKYLNPLMKFLHKTMSFGV